MKHRWGRYARRGTFMAGLLFSVACTHAATPGTSAPSEALPSPGVLRPLLWRIQSGPNRLYLFGTLHGGVQARSEMPPIVWRLMKESPCFVMETDLDVAPAVQDQLLHYMTLPSGDSLERHLSPAAWQQLRERFKDRYDERTLRQMRPWVLASEFMQDQFEGGELMDQELKKQAVREHDTLHYLEKITDQLAIVADVVSFEDLENLILHADDLTRLSNDMLKVYRSGDAEGLRQLVEDERAGLSNNPRQLDKLLYARNRQWVPQLENFARHGPCFVAVGAGHLLGERGVVTLMKKEGYDVERLP